MSVQILNKTVYGPAFTKDLPKGGLGCMIFEACDKFAQKICHISARMDNNGNASETYASFKERTSRVAAELQRRGLQPKDVIVVCCPNNYDNALSTAAAMYLGAIPAAMDPTLSDRECGHLLAVTEPKFVFVHEDSIELMESALQISGLALRDDKQPVVVVHGQHSKHSKQYVNFDKFLEKPCGDFKPFYQNNLDETVLMLFSSGSTGLSKAICVTHRTLFSGAVGFLDLMDDPSVMMHFTTFYWISATLVFASQFLIGACRVGGKGFTAESTCRYISEHKITACFMASSFGYQFEELHKCSLQTDISSLKTIVFAGGPLSSDQMTKARKWFPAINLFLGYGMTESASFVTGFNAQDRHTYAQHVGSCGRPLLGMQVRVVDPGNETPLNPNETGEIRYKTLGKINGYYKMNEQLYDDDDFFKSGDLGYYDHEGLVFVCDRIKDMFKYLSWHIVPAALEAVVKEHPSIEEAVVFGVPHETAENLPAVAVVLKPNCIASEEEIEMFVSERVIDRQKLRGGVYIIDSVPKTPSGKIQRRKLKESMMGRIQQLK